MARACTSKLFLRVLQGAIRRPTPAVVRPVPLRFVEPADNVCNSYGRLQSHHVVAVELSFERP